VLKVHPGKTLSANQELRLQIDKISDLLLAYRRQFPAAAVRPHGGVRKFQLYCEAHRLPLLAMPDAV
jgi:hypothetical protein